MQSLALGRLDAEIAGVCAFLNANQMAREIAAMFPTGSEPSLIEAHLDDLRRVAPSSTAWRVYDHCAAMSRIYALFEQFCESVLAEWIEFRSREAIFSTLPLKMQDAYAAGFAAVLADLHKVRFSHLSGSDMVAEYHKALNGDVGYRLASECLTQHRGNIRWEDISAMFERCGIPSLGEWVSSHHKLVEYYQTKSRILEQTQSTLASFVQYRNDSAHAIVAVDEILGRDQILDIAEFVRSFCQCLSECTLRASLEFLIDIGAAAEVGVVTELKRNNVAICNLEGATISVGSRLHLVARQSCTTHIVDSLMLDDVPTNVAVIAKAMEVGIKFDRPGTRRARVITLL